MTSSQQSSGADRRGEPSWKFVAFGLVLLFAILAAGVMFVLRSRNQRFTHDPYIRANDAYTLGVQQAARGSYRKAFELLESAMRELERSPGKNPDKLPVPPNALSHNTSALLAVIAAKLRRCDDYRKYRDLTQRIAENEWSFSLQGENNPQTDLDKKAALIYKARQEIRSMEPACPENKSRLPLKQSR